MNQPTKTKKCKVCGDLFAYEKKSAKFCGDRCRQTAKRLRDEVKPMNVEIDLKTALDIKYLLSHCEYPESVRMENIELAFEATTQLTRAIDKHLKIDDDKGD